MVDALFCALSVVVSHSIKYFTSSLTVRLLKNKTWLKNWKQNWKIQNREILTTFCAVKVEPSNSQQTVAL